MGSNSLISGWIVYEDCNECGEFCKWSRQISGDLSVEVKARLCRKDRHIVYPHTFPEPIGAKNNGDMS